MNWPFFAAKDKLLSIFLFFKLPLIIFIWFGIITVKTLPNIFVPNINPTLKNANLAVNIFVKPKEVSNNKKKAINIKSILFLIIEDLHKKS